MEFKSKEMSDFFNREFELSEKQDKQIFKDIAAGKQWEAWYNYKKRTTWFQRLKNNFICL